jgi:hypothetical protein
MSINQISYPNVYPVSVGLSSLTISQGTPNTATGYSSALINCQSTGSGLLPPVMTTTQKLAISSPVKGLQVFDSTLNSPSYYNGTEWDDGGSQAVISRTVLTGATGSFTFSSIPQTFNNLKILISAQGTGVVSTPIGARFNSEATGPYQYQTLQNGLSSTVSAYTGSTSLYLGEVAKVNGNYFGQGKYDILNYADSTTVKNLSGMTSFVDNSTGIITNVSGAISSGNANKFAPISSLTILEKDNGIFSVGSTFEIIGYN